MFLLFYGYINISPFLITILFEGLVSIAILIKVSSILVSLAILVCKESCLNHNSNLFSSFQLSLELTALSVLFHLLSKAVDIS